MAQNNRHLGAARSRRAFLRASAAIVAATAVVGPGWGSGEARATELSDPPPSYDDPRKVLLTLTTADPTRINNILYNVVNIQKFYGQDNVRVAVVAWGPGVRAMLKDQSPVRARIESLLMYDVEFLACGNTMNSMHWKKSDLIDGVEMTTAGIPEVVERRLRGWVDITP